jgi:hypothetical protein
MMPGCRRTVVTLVDSAVAATMAPDEEIIIG